MSTTSEAHILVTLPNATFTSSSGGTLAGRLALEYVTFDIPAATTATNDVLLVLRLGDGAFEEPLDPARTLTTSVLPSGARRYVFHATRDDAEFTLELPVTPETADDVELFHGVLVGYATDFHGDVAASHGALPATRAYQNASGGSAVDVGVVPDEDLRGRFVLMNEDSGEIVGALDRSVRVHEDPSLGEKGHEADPVVVELPEGADTLDDVEVLVRIVPPEDRDWMMWGAVFASHVISGTATVLASAMTSASNYYISHSTPSQHPTGGKAPSTSDPSSSSNAPPPPPPSRTLLLLQSPTTRKHLTRVHAVSGSAVKLSNKAAAAVDRLIVRAGGTDKGKGRASASSSSSSSSSSAVPTPPVRPQSLSASSLNKPPLPLRERSKSPSGSRAPSRTPPPSRPLDTRGRAVLSAAIILASLSASAVRVVDAGGAAVSAAVSHKYGPTAGENAALAAGTMRNVVLVYVDLRGFTRRAIVKRMAKGWVKGGRIGPGPRNP